MLPQAQDHLMLLEAGHSRKILFWSFWRGRKPAYTLIADFWPPKLRE